ncbi:hypothetical protein LOZ66_002190 [Ophidiomyces ophidiicola]|nr:hypothetical protein LOZ66_002190 [Ophidiomyces ophidiicola]
MALLIESSAKSAMSLCRACNASRVNVRLFSSSQSSMVGPESPNYVDIPRIIQPILPRKEKLKGVLPTPRELFPPRRPDKPTVSYLSDATPEPSTDKPKVEKHHPLYEQLEWKRRMAEVRRKNLREGLIELYRRKQKAKLYTVNESQEKEARRAQISRQPARNDEVLTSMSNVQDIGRKRRTVLPDPNAEQRLAKSKANVAMKQRSKSEDRIDSIHTLYMNARSFIVTEEQLNAEIERVFPEGENPEWTNDRTAGDSVWNLGPPPTVNELLHRKDEENSRWVLLQERTKTIAETLTGGKI